MFQHVEQILGSVVVPNSCKLESDSCRVADRDQYLSQSSVKGMKQLTMGGLLVLCLNFLDELG